MEEGSRLKVTYAGRSYEVQAGSGWTLGALGEELARLCGVDPATVKLLTPKAKGKDRGGALVPSAEPGRTLGDAGLVDGAKVMMVASKAADVEFVQSQKELPRMRGFEAEAALSSARRRTGRRAIGPPTGKYTFGRYEALQLPGVQPPPEAALALLYRLAADPGIVGVMQRHRWAVGVLKEMPPEGKVGVSPVCVLGLNVNKGAEIHLRLRTDDLRGFRRYRSIRDTLVHELTHMVWGDHDNNFKELNSQLLRECSELNAFSTEGSHTLAGGDVFAAEEAEAAPAAPHTLRAYMESGTSQFERWDAATAAAEAAMKRLEAMAGPPPADGDAAAPPQGEQPARSAAPGPSEAPASAAARGDQSAAGSSAEQRGEQQGVKEGQEEPAAEDMDVDEAGAAPPEPAEDAAGSLAAPEGPAGGGSNSHDASGGSGADAAFPSVGDDDPALQTYNRVRSALAGLLQTLPGSDAGPTLSTLATILENVLQNPREERFRRLRCSNRAFQARVGQHPCAVQVLKAAGFSYVAASQQPTVSQQAAQLQALAPQQEGDLLCLTRDDPGLLWLSLSAVREAAQQH